MREIKVAAISDLHGLTPSVPACDILIIAGDICPVTGSHAPARQLAWLRNTFLPWCSDQLVSGVGHIVFTPGNHDFVFQRFPLIETPQYVTCLIDREITVCGVRIYGSPWSSRFGNWAFMLNPEGLAEKFSKIPEGLDILITHGPAYGWCDEILLPMWPPMSDDPHLGSPELAARIKAARPRWHLCGHIHTGNHKPEEVLGGVTAANVSLIDEGYARIYDPLEFSIFREEDEV